jgi:putative glutamine amidotransferase
MTTSFTQSSRPRIAIPVPTADHAEYNDRCWPEYAAAVEAAGGEPVRIPLGLEPSETARLAATCAGVVLPGSPADVDPQ